MNKIILALLLIITLSPVSYTYADDATDFEAAASQLKDIRHRLSRGHFEDNDLNNWTKFIIKINSAADLCVSNSEAASLKLKTVIDGLGEKVKGEDTDVTKKRKKYQKKKAAIDKTLAKCNLYVVNTDEISKQISDAEKSYFKQKYLVRGPHMVELVVEYLKNPIQILQESGSFISKRSGLYEIDLQNLSFSITAILLAIVLGLYIRKKLLLLEGRRKWKDDFSEKMVRALITTSACSAPYLTGSATAAISALIVTYNVKKIPFIAEFSVGILLYFLVTSIIRLLFSPVPPAKLFMPFTPSIAELLARRLRVLAVLSLVGYLAFYTVFSQSLNEANQILSRNVFSLFFVMNVVWTLHVVIRSPRFPKFHYLTWIVIIAMLASLIAEWMGYQNLAFSGRRIVMLSFVIFVTFMGVATVFKDLFDAVDKGSYQWCRRLHKTLGVENNRVPGLIWFRLLTTIIIWGVFAFLIINVWDYSGGVIEQVRGYIVNGFNIGDFRIVPSRVLWALLLFGLVIIFSSWVRSQLENNWLKMTTMGQGARDAMVTITGYIMFIIAIFAGLSAAGFNFGNIAIVAGALSVGIGFGLQNIVNNFVSGLILLFERPIRKGDWVVVGTTEGTVKDILIRSTRIETFDRSDVIVPNSELIANQVTNWVLSGDTGRATIPIGVAYGTDTDKVRDILLAIAEENEDVIKTGVVPKPKVLFREFGDSSLNFELRVFLQRIGGRLDVISDINFAIDKAFREAKIEIPFPQRDLHVKSLPESIKSEPVESREKSESSTTIEASKGKETKHHPPQPDASDFDADT